MKFEITQTRTQTVSIIVDAKDIHEANGLIEDEDFLQELAIKQLECWETDDEEWEVKPVKETVHYPREWHNIEKGQAVYYARQCNISGEGMDNGWLFGDNFYIKYEKDLIQHLKQVYDEDFGNYKKDELNGIIDEDKLRELLYEKGYYYYTEWDDPKDVDYVKIDGKLSLINK